MSLNGSADFLDLSIKNFWIIAHYPHSDPGSEFEIIAKGDLEMDTCDVIEKGALVTVKFGNARVQGSVVTVSDDYGYLMENFAQIIEEYSQEDQSKNQETIHIRSFRHIIKIADKETQTEENNSDDYKLLQQKYQQLQAKYDRLQNSLNKVTEGVNGVVNILEEAKELYPADSKDILKDRNVDENVTKENSGKMVQIGSGGTKVAQYVFDTIKWHSYTAATRKLLITLFPRHVLATHSLTGKPSPAFLSSNKQKKMKLDPVIISDIIEIITRKSHVSESLVRNAITTKCADENKMYKKRIGALKKEDDEENDREAAKRLKMI